MKLTFEWDEAKNLANIEKHGFSFQNVSGLFYEDNVVLDSHKNREKRYILVAKYKTGVFVWVIYTTRPPNIRIISARRSKKQEIQAYIQKFNQS